MKRKNPGESTSVPSFLIFLIFTLVLCTFCTLLTIHDNRAAAGKPTDAEPITNKPSVDHSYSAPLRTVVIDPGHGGEDGGASSASGLVEKDINLSVALILRDYLTAAGVPTVLTRDEDILLYDKTSEHEGRKKILDLSSRLYTAKDTENAIFVSIHMNSFVQPQYKGLQVWYSKNDPISADIAKSIQDTAAKLFPENKRKIKAAGDNIYLLHRLDSPAVLVEGGFLSNPEDAALLGTHEHQKALAFMIFSSIMEYIQ